MNHAGETLFDPSPFAQTFFGRANKADTIKEYIFNFIFDVGCSEAVQLIHIAGPPGIGKTSLAIRVSQEMETECMEFGIPFQTCYVDLQNETKFVSALQQISNVMGASPSHTSGRKLIRELNSRVCTSFSELLILDGVEGLLSDEEAGGEFLGFCEELISRRSTRSHGVKRFVIVTATIKFQLPRSADRIYTFPLLPLTLDEVQEWLLHIVSQQDFDECLEDLAECSAGFPIAVLLIGAVIKTRRMNPRTLVDSLLWNWTGTLRKNDAEGMMRQVERVVHFCLENLPNQLRKDYAKLAFIPASFTAETASFITSTSEEARSSAIVKHDVLLPLHDRCFLEVYNLLDPTSKQQRFHIHQVLRSFVEDRYHLLHQDLKETRNRYCVFYGTLLLKMAPLLESNYAMNLPVFTIEIRNVEKLLREAVHCLGDNTSLFLEAAYQSHMLIETFLPTAEAVEFYKACVNAAQLRVGPGGVDKLSEARMLLVYGKMLGAAKTDFELEHEQYKKCMRLLKPRGDCVEMALLLYSIGGNLHSRGKRCDAIRMLRETLQVLARLEDCHSYNHDNGESEPARKCQGKSTKQDTSQSGAICPNTMLSIRRIRANTTYLLGVIYAWIGDTNEAERFHLESLQMKRHLWGESHPSIGVGYNGLSLVYEKTGQSDKAARFCFLGLDIKRKFLREPSVGMIVSLNNSARHLSQQKGEHKRALKLLDESFRMRQKLGLNHRDTSLIYNNRGKVYSWMGDWKNAVENFEKAVALRREFLGKHASTAGSMHLLGKAYLKVGATHRAVDALTECIEMREDVVMTEQPLSEERAGTLEPLAEAYHRTGRLKDAARYYDQTMVELKRLGIEHRTAGRTDRSERLESKCAEIQEKLEFVNVDIAKQGFLLNLHWKLICITVCSCVLFYWFGYHVLHEYFK